MVNALKPLPLGTFLVIIVLYWKWYSFHCLIYIKRGYDYYYYLLLHTCMVIRFYTRNDLPLTQWVLRYPLEKGYFRITDETNFLVWKQEGPTPYGGEFSIQSTNTSISTVEAAPIRISSHGLPSPAGAYRHSETSPRLRKSEPSKPSTKTSANDSAVPNTSAAAFNLQQYHLHKQKQTVNPGRGRKGHSWKQPWSDRCTRTPLGRAWIFRYVVSHWCSRSHSP